MTRYSAVLLCLVSTACGTTLDRERKVSPEDQLSAFLAQSGSASLESIDWEHAVPTAALRRVMESDPTQAALGPNGSPQAYASIGDLDLAQMSREAQAHWSKSWKAPVNCKHERVETPPLPTHADESLPASLRKTLTEVAAAAHFKVTCDEGRAYEISVGREGRIVVLIDNSADSIEDLLRENTFE